MSSSRTAGRVELGDHFGLATSGMVGRALNVPAWNTGDSQGAGTDGFRYR